MQQSTFRFWRSSKQATMLSLIHPNKEFLQRHQPLLRRAVPAGFLSPADNYVERCPNLDERLMEHKESTFS